MIRKLGKGLLFVMVNLVVVLLAMIICEGTSSLILFFRESSFVAPVAERSHTQYDAELGWVNTPGVTIPDLYGPGLDVQINAQGFRNTQDFAPTIPAGKVRLICSGDSFTLGYGVANDETWCHYLTVLNPRLQTVNMGQGGYGLGQMYLWYQRDGATIDHDIHVFAFISNDFDRLQTAEFLGYGKPLLQVVDGSLQITNVPVPQPAFYMPWVTQNRQTLLELKSIELARSMNEWFMNRELDDAAPPAPSSSSPELVVLKIFEALQQLNIERNSQLVLVYLPTLNDYNQSEPVKWRHHAAEAAQQAGIPYFDLTPDFQQLPPEQMVSLFLQRVDIDFPGAVGHYSAAGHHLAAELLYARLLTLPEIGVHLN